MRTCGPERFPVSPALPARALRNSCPLSFASSQAAGRSASGKQHPAPCIYILETQLTDVGLVIQLSGMSHGLSVNDGSIPSITCLACVVEAPVTAALQCKPSTSESPRGGLWWALLSGVGASTLQLTQRGHRAEVPVLERDRGHARRARARLLVQLPGQVPALLLGHLDAPAAGLAPDHRPSCKPGCPSLPPAMLTRLHAVRAPEASSQPCSSGQTMTQIPDLI